MRLLTFDVNHESDTAGVVLISGVVKSLLNWESVIHFYTALPIRCFGMSHQYTKS